jgi:hypothetical protein
VQILYELIVDRSERVGGSLDSIGGQYLRHRRKWDGGRRKEKVKRERRRLNAKKIYAANSVGTRNSLKVLKKGSIEIKAGQKLDIGIHEVM